MTYDADEWTASMELKAERAALAKRCAELEQALAHALAAAALERRARQLTEEGRRHAFRQLANWR